MFISQIKFRMNVETAPYKHEHVEVTVELNDGEDTDAAFAYARDSARDFLGVNVTADDVECAEKVLAAAKKAGLRK